MGTYTIQFTSSIDDLDTGYLMVLPGDDYQVTFNRLRATIFATEEDASNVAEDYIDYLDEMGNEIDDDKYNIQEAF